MATASKVTYIYVTALVVFGMGFHFLQKLAKHYTWWAYAEAPKPKKGSKHKAKLAE